MNKTQLITAMAEKSSKTKKETEEVLNAFLQVAEETLEKGESIQLVGFGTFEVRERAAREGTNPMTKEAISIPARKVPAFKAGKALKEAVNK